MTEDLLLPHGGSADLPSSSSYPCVTDRDWEEAAGTEPLHYGDTQRLSRARHPFREEQPRETASPTTVVFHPHPRRPQGMWAMGIFVCGVGEGVVLARGAFNTLQGTGQPRHKRSSQVSTVLRVSKT